MSSTTVSKKAAAATKLVFLKQDPSKKSFSDLPGELRNEIYRLSLVNSIPIVLDVLESKARVYYEDNNVKGAYKPFREATISLLRTCKVINVESTPILLGENTFVIDVGGRWIYDSAPSDLQPFLDFALIRRLVIRVHPPMETILVLTGNIKDRLTVLGNVFRSIEHLHFCAVEIHSRGSVSEYTDQRWVEPLDRFLSIVSSAKATEDIVVPVSHCTFGSVPEDLWRAKHKQTCLKINMPVPQKWSSPALSDTDWGALLLRLRGPNPSMRFEPPPCYCSNVLDHIIKKLKPKLTYECQHPGETVHSLTEYISGG